MANFCPKCGRPLENDNFCSNCMEYARANEEVDNSSSYNTSTTKQGNVPQNQGTNFQWTANKGTLNQARGNQSSMNQGNPSQGYSNQGFTDQSQSGQMQQGQMYAGQMQGQTSQNHNSSYQVPPYTGTSNTTPMPKEKLSAKQFLLVIASFCVIIGVSTLLIFLANRGSKDSDSKETSVMVEEDSNSEDLDSDDISLYSEDNQESNDSLEADASQDTDASSAKDSENIAEDTESADSNYIDVDYDEIIATGEPCNGYAHFSISKEEFVSMMDQYYEETGDTVDFSTDMDNYYENTDDGKFTYYETYSIWDYTDDTQDQFYISTDTVTEELMYIAVITTTPERAEDLITKSMQIADPNLLDTDISDAYEEIAASDEATSVNCGNYMIYGGYDNGYYYYYIYQLS